MKFGQLTKCALSLALVLGFTPAAALAEAVADETESFEVEPALVLEELDEEVVLDLVASEEEAVEEDAASVEEVVDFAVEEAAEAVTEDAELELAGEETEEMYGAYLDFETGLWCDIETGAPYIFDDELSLASVDDDNLELIKAQILDVLVNLKFDYITFNTCILPAVEVPLETLLTAYWSVFYDDTDFFYVEPVVYWSYNRKGLINSIMLFSYLNPGIIPTAKANYNQATQSALASCVDDSMTDYEKALAIHDYLIRTTTFDENWDYRLCRTAYAPLVANVGRETGYAMAYMHLLRQVGIECMYVEADDLFHGWNIVKLDGNWYHVDVAWDELAGSEGYNAPVNHSNFLRSDESMIALGHDNWGLPYPCYIPVCDSDYDYPESPDSALPPVAFDVTMSQTVKNATGSALTPIITVSAEGEVLTEGVDYQVLYNGSVAKPVAPGTYTVSIQGKGMYANGYCDTELENFVIYSAVNYGSTTKVKIASTYDISFVLDTAGDDPVKGANVSVWTDHNGSNQQWYLELGADGYYVIKSTYAAQTFVLDAAGAEPVKGANVSNWEPNGGANQKWIIIPNGDGSYRIASTYDITFVLDAAGEAPVKGANVSIWTDNGGKNQQWYILPA